MTDLTINTPGVKVLRLHEEHIDGIIELMNREGWYYYDHREMMRYLKLNQDCFTILKDGCITGSIFTTNYGNQVWIGNIIVAKEARGKGLATKLIGSVIDYLHNKKHVQTFRLGAVPLAIGLYKKLGFKAEAFTTSQEAELPIKIEFDALDPGENVQVDRLETCDLEAIIEIDERYFKSKRLQFLTYIYNDSIKKCCFCLKDHGKVVGFIMLRRREVSKEEGITSKGPDYAYRLGPSCVLPEYGINGFKALFQEAIRAVNEEVCQLGGSARIYVVFPKSANKEGIYNDTRGLAKIMGMDDNMDLDRVFNEHNQLFGMTRSIKNEEQWVFMEGLGFRQEYFEQVMSYTPGESAYTQPEQKKAEETRADPEGIFASATAGDMG